MTSRSERRSSTPSRPGSGPESGTVMDRAAPAKLSEHFVWRYEERVLLQQPPDDDHGVGSHDVHHNAPAKLGEIVRSRDGVVVLRENEVQPCFVFDDVLDARTILEGPLHVGDEPCEGKTLLLALGEHRFDQSEHRVLVEVASAKVSVFPAQNLELTASLGGVCVDPVLAQARHVIRPVIRIDDVEGPVTVLEAFGDERHEDPIFLITVVKKRADMTSAIKHRASEVNRTLP